MKRTIALAGIAALLVGCGGGGSGSTTPVSAPHGAPTPHQTASATLTITIPPPARPGTAGKRRPLYVSSGANWLTFTPNGGSTTGIDISSTSGNCTPASGGGRTCTVNAPVPVGTNVQFTVALYTSSTSTTPLSIATATQPTVTANTTNPISLTLNAVVGSLSVALNPTALTPTTTSSTVTVTALDPSGATIVIGTESLVDQNDSTVTIGLADSDTSGATNVSPASLTNPATTATLTYNGTGTPNGTTITATAKNASNQTIGTPATANFTVTPPAVQHLYVASVDTSNTCHVDQFALYNGSNASSFKTPLNSFTLTSTKCAGLAVGPTGAIYVSTSGTIKEYAAGTTGANPTAAASYTTTSPGLPWVDANMAAGTAGSASGALYSSTGNNFQSDGIAVTPSLSSQSTITICGSGGLTQCSTGVSPNNEQLAQTFVDRLGNLYATVFGTSRDDLYAIPQGVNTAVDPSVTSLTGNALFPSGATTVVYASDGTTLFMLCECGVAGYKLETFAVPTSSGATAAPSATSSAFAIPNVTSTKPTGLHTSLDATYIYAIEASRTNAAGRQVWVFTKSSIASTTAPTATLNLDTTATSWLTVGLAVGP